VVGALEEERSMASGRKVFEEAQYPIRRVKHHSGNAQSMYDL
jgi:hypothetical protein